ncbi:hypothetical protein H5407_02055 [Mitsuaria sp. WAJ17]|uniref:hypothetical protein n=1 Tax=Mitsuaria sp. WAJ17 TaxID=2761452 RepID=UPI0016045925|nr:hypothetical protein [Mitsuaria sp. WAJ17]MBB2484002.1 hypothetical protein [Mitsuaria sp. WAJ17]
MTDQALKAHKPLVKHLGSALALAAALTAPSLAQADVLLEGATIALLTGTSAAAEPQLAGVIIEDRSDAFSFSSASGTVSGSIQSRVVRSIDGTVDFYWRVVSDAGSADDLGSFRLGQLFTSEYRVNWRNDGIGDVSPVNAHRFSGTMSGDINFNFQRLDTAGAMNGLGAGLSSYFMFLDTDATAYDFSGLMDVADMNHTHISSLFSTFAPTVGKVPEPGSLALAGLALGLLPLRRRGGSR